MLSIIRHFEWPGNKGWDAAEQTQGAWEGCQVWGRVVCRVLVLQWCWWQVTSTRGTMCDYGQAQALPLLLLLLGFLVKTPVLRKFVEISCSGFGRGGKLTGQQTHAGNIEGARQARCHLRTHRVHWTALKHSIEGDKEKQVGNWRWNSQCLSTANSVPCADLREGAATGF